MDLALPFALVREALVLAVALSVPVVAAAAAVAVIASAMQGAFGLHDPALAHLPKLLAVVVATAAAAPWMVRALTAFAVRAFGG